MQDINGGEIPFDPMDKFEKLLEEISEYDGLSEERLCDIFDECEAWYILSIQWHNGQNDPLYAVTGRLESAGYQPGPMVDSYEHLTEYGQEHYDSLMQDFGFDGDQDEW